MTRAISSREFNQDVSGAKRLAEEDGPVTITDRGNPAFVLMTHENYLRLLGTTPNIMDLLHDPASEDFEFKVKRVKGDRIRPVKFD
jgi:prevent-host-death family protein